MSSASSPSALAPTASTASTPSTPSHSVRASIAAAWRLVPPAERRHLLLHVPLSVVAAFVELLCAAAVFALIDRLVSSELRTVSIAEARLGLALELRELAVVAVVLFVAKAVVTAFTGHRLSGVVEHIRADLMARVLARALTSPWLVHLERGPSGVVHEIAHDVSIVTDEVLSSSAQLLANGLVGLALAVPLVVAAPKETAVAGGLALAWVAVVHLGSRRLARTLSARERTSLQTAQGVLAGALSALRELASLGRTRDVVAAYRAALNDTIAARQQRATLAAQPRLWSESLVVIALAVSVFFGVDVDTFALLGAGAYAAMRLLPLANGSAWLLWRVQSGALSVRALADLPAANALGEVTRRPRATCGAAIDVDGVSFAYPGFPLPGRSGPGAPPVLRDVSLHIAAHEHVAIVGPSGAGKSTLLGLIVGTHVADAGHVFIDGHAPRDCRVRVAYVPQECALLRGSLKDNLTLAAAGVTDGDVSDADVDAALAVAALDDRRELPAGADTAIGEGGAGLSGGQRQRVALARAIAFAPAVLILDEATSALDRELEARVMDRLRAWAAGRCTIVIVTHRRDVAARCDRVVELDGGALLAAGPR
jgi:ABC-type multidrug transport system fused ATPase/permease subunit